LHLLINLEIIKGCNLIIPPLKYSSVAIATLTMLRTATSQ